MENRTYIRIESPRHGKYMSRPLLCFLILNDRVCMTYIEVKCMTIAKIM